MGSNFIKKIPQEKAIIVCGATATGKSKLAMNIAGQLNGVIINADSMQIYREIPIITAQPTIQDMQYLPHRLYGFAKCKDLFSVGRWLKEAQKEIEYCKVQSKVPIIVGGTGMYIKALIYGLTEIPEISEKTKSTIKDLLKVNTIQALHLLLSNYDPLLAQKLSPNDTQRILRGLEVYEETKIPLSHFQQKQSINPYLKRENYFIIYLNPPRDEIYNRCNNRFLEMVKNDVVSEVQSLITNQKNITYPKALGLYEMIEFLKNKVSLETAISLAQQKTRNYAKRQTTWFSNQLQYDIII